MFAANFGLAVAPSGVVFACGYGGDGVTATRGLIMAREKAKALMVGKTE